MYTIILLFSDNSIRYLVSIDNFVVIRGQVCVTHESSHVSASTDLLLLMVLCAQLRNV